MTFVAEEPNKVPFSVQAVGHSEVMRFSNTGNNVFMRFATNARSVSNMVIGSSNNTMYLGNTMFIA
jgi:hypothetical protein